MFAEGATEVRAWSNLTRHHWLHLVFGPDRRKNQP